MYYREWESIFEILDRKPGKVTKTWVKVKKKASYVGILRKNTSGRRKAKCTGCEMGACLDFPRNSKESSMAKAD